MSATDPHADGYAVGQPISREGGSPAVLVAAGPELPGLTTLLAATGDTLNYCEQRLRDLRDMLLASHPAVDVEIYASPIGLVPCAEDNAQRAARCRDLIDEIIAAARG